MTLLQFFLTWGAVTGLVAAVSARPAGARAGLIVATVFLAVPVFMTRPPTRAGVALLALVCFVRTADFVLDGAPGRFRARWMHLVMLVNTYEVGLQRRRIDYVSAIRLAMSIALFVVGRQGLNVANALPLWERYAGRWTAGALMLFACVDAVVCLHVFVAGLLGIALPRLHDAPYRSLSVGEFWGRRWNLTVSRVLRQRCFEPLARRSVVLALVGSFAASAATHLYILGAALGPRAALSCAAFFLVQPLILLAERRLNVRRWPRLAAWVWTMSTLGLFAPLLLEPAVSLFMR